MPTNHLWRTRALLCMTGATLALSACGTQDTPPSAPPPTDVAVVRVEPAAIAIADELPGRVVAFRIAEIRPQVGGIIRRRLFEQGTEVRAGQPLFQIDPAPFAAEAATAAAALQRAQAVLSRARTQQQRLAPLVQADAISGQSYDDAEATRIQAAADVAQNRATLERRRLDVGFATVRSPIAGRIDQAMLTEGALATVGGAAALATVQQIDRVFIDVRQPAARLGALLDAARTGTGNQGAAVEILASDGRPHPMPGRLLFSGISVDPATGEVIARVEVRNPDRSLLPGMFVRARLPRLFQRNALTLPQQAVQHDAIGKAHVSIVANGRVTKRDVVTGDEQDGRFVITQGLHPGDLVIVEGQDRVQADTNVRAVPWRASAASARQR